MLEISPEMVLGKTVVNAKGSTLGAVVDVGVHDVRRVKFLLVEPSGRDPTFVRLSVDTIETISPNSVRLKPT